MQWPWPLAKANGFTEFLPGFGFISVRLYKRKVCCKGAEA
jgi:hypothetical protein